MNMSHDNLDKLKEKNPFKLPEGYMNGLTEQVMSQLPEQIREKEPPRVTLKEKLRPLFYMAAMFVGMTLILKFMIGTTGGSGKENSSDSLLVKTEIPNGAVTPKQTYNEDEEYLEYVEEQYSGYLLKREVDFSE